MENNLVISDENARSFEIQPEDIDTEKNFFHSFDNMETETSARWVVELLQQKGQGWVAFTYEEIQAFYSQYFKSQRKSITSRFLFNRLVEPQMIPPDLARAFAGYLDPLIPAGGGWIVESEGKYRVTYDFVMRCFQSSPKKNKTA